MAALSERVTVRDALVGVRDGQRPAPNGAGAAAHGKMESTPVHVQFERQAVSNPGATALRFEGGAWSYQELDAWANRFASALAQSVASGTAVAFCLDRGPETIGVMLAILKLGAAYVPLDAAYPPARLQEMVAISAARVIITTRALAARMPEGAARLLLVDQVIDSIGAAPAERLETPVTPADRAYIMFTSGSTGEPKGVEIPHRAIDRLVCGVDYVDLGPRHVVLQAAPLTFDASTFEVWGPLLTGGVCVLYPDHVPSMTGLGRVIGRHHVTTVWLTAGLFNAVIDEAPEQLRGVEQLLIGGEALSVAHVQRAQVLLPGTRIINGYGPTESTTFAACYSVPADLPPDIQSIPIGRPIRDTRCYILDATQQPVPPGATGELYIGGAGVALGYTQRPDLTAQRFLPDPFSDDPGARMYRTGDLARYREDGTLDYIGRVDDQLKISGHRIEPREIATRLESHPSVQQCVVVAIPRAGELGPKLVAYLVTTGGAPLCDTSLLRAHLRETLPEYMIPAAFVPVPTLPLTANGKIDVRALPLPEASEDAGALSLDGPRGEVEQQLADTWRELLGTHVGMSENVFDRGATSLLVVRALARLRSRHQLEIPVTYFFQYPTIAGLAAALRGGSGTLPASDSDRGPVGGEISGRAEPVAIIGMAVRLPGAPDLETFWQNLRTGTDSITRFQPGELDPDIAPELRSDPAYVAARGILSDADRFDAEFFGISPREAELMDPQQRIFLEVAWTALEHAGYDPAQVNGRVGVFGGVYNNSYATSVLAHRPEVVERFGAFNAMLLNEKDYVAPRAAHKLGLTGPAVSIHTACSTSLVAVCQAVRSLRSGECEMALAGGVALTIPIASGHRYQEGGMLSADGTTRPFDTQATGTVFSDGAALVVLKRLVDARRDGDTIHAVICGVAVNNDGANKASFTAPSVDGQAAVIRAAQHDAGVSPRSISYVEAHGTATPLGDPIEFEGLRQVFGAASPDVGFCRLGSVKSNIGHTVIAAGAAGLIKTALALSHEELPPSLHFTAPNPAIQLDGSPFSIPTTATPWPRDVAPRRAGVSSFGVGGTNAHVVLEESPIAPASATEGGLHLLPLSARTPAALAALSARLATALESRADLQMGDVAYTLQCGRRHFAHRRTIVARSREEAIAALRAGPSPRDTIGVAGARSPDVVFMFPGQGSQYPEMGAALYTRERVYRDAFDRCADAIAPIMGRDLREIVFAAGDDAARALQQTAVTQPALFATEFALAALWQSWGLRPRAMIGHSVGEFVCAAVSGVMSPEDAARVVASRGRAVQSLSAGSMLSVRLPAETLARRLDPELAVASENSPALCVVAGPTAHIDALRAPLESERVACRVLHTSHAFHSAMMEPVVQPLGELLERVVLAPPVIPFVSTVTGEWIKPEEACDPWYWAHHLRKTVRFASGVRTLLHLSPSVFLELGPRSTLTTFVRQQFLKDTGHSAVPVLGDSADRMREVEATLMAIGRTWSSGLQLDWGAIQASADGRRVSIPTYPFDRTRYWLETSGSSSKPIPLSLPVPEVRATTAHALTDARQVIDRDHVMATQNGAGTAHKSGLNQQIRDTLEQVSGVDVGPDDTATSLMELGFDSLALTQVALALSKSYGVKLTFRQLLEEYTTVDQIAQHLDAVRPADPRRTAHSESTSPPATSQPPTAPSVGEPTRTSPLSVAVTEARASRDASPGAPTSAHDVIATQLRIMEQQLAILSRADTPRSDSLHRDEIREHSGDAEGGGASRRPAVPMQESPAGDLSSASDVAAVPSTGPQRALYDAKKAFGAAPRITVAKSDHLTPKQRARLDAFARRYTAKTKESKQYTQKHRLRMADPRVATGFRPTVKELVYPLVMTRSSGARMWDLDGNEYIDVLSGFGSNLFGWSPPFIVDAIRAQLERGYELGPQQPLAGEVAELFCDFTGHDRVAFCNTGSEAVLGAIRIARTVTGRNTIAVFTGSYHGINDEVIVRAAKAGRAVAAAPGILPAAVQNVLVLEYGSDEALATIRARGDELAAVLVEPIQSRRPDLRPREFLHELRRITEQMGIVYIWDEIVTGFRIAPRGAQEYFDVQADLATYGKVVGGGLPIGVVAGRRDYMDALDGGFWRFGDESVPEVGVTYFAGTFVRHPLALAAAKAVLTHLAQHGPAFQRDISDRTDRLVAELTRIIAAAGAPIQIRNFASIWKTMVSGEHPHADLLFYLLRESGIHIYEGFPCFMTAAHTDADIAEVSRAFAAAVTEMQEGEFLPRAESHDAPVLTATAPPVPGARLGRDRDGTPAWFVANPTDPGRFVRVAPV